ncbi:MAG: cysteine desulfurase [Alphaproteobacteria bacterium]|nr:MAG: cysteine desulfurase [Alphaproteobacteria bacterium]
MIYLDYNATALMKPEVIGEMTRVMAIGGNPSSVHALGRGARAILEQSRGTIAHVINCRPQKIIFTGGGTEANNIALRATDRDHIIIGATEHDSIGAIKTHFTGTVKTLPVDENGLISSEDLTKALVDSPEKTLVSLMLANNETGVVQDIKTLADISHRAGALFHTDAIQALGKIAVDFRDLGVDMMSFSAHKLSGPQGVGALVALEKIDIQSINFGGGQEVGRRPGTENLAGIAGFAKAVELVPENLIAMDYLRILRDRIEQEISAIAPEVIFYGAKADRLPNTTTILMPNVSSETQVMAFDLDGICVSSGSACSSGKVKPSHVVSAMGAQQDQALSTIRVSLGWKTTESDVDAFIAAWIKLYNRKRM